MENFNLLRGMQSLEDVPDDVVTWLAGEVEEMNFAAGEQIITEGAFDRDCFFIAEGLTDVAMGGRLIGRTPAGEPEGEMSLFLHRPRGCTTTAVSDLRTLRLRAEAYDALVESDPSAAAALREGVLAHMRRRFGT